MLGQEVQLDDIVEEPSNEYDEDYDNEENESGDDTTEEEPCFSSDGCYEPETDTDSASEHDEDMHSSDNSCLIAHGVVLHHSSKDVKMMCCEY